MSDATVQGELTSPKAQLQPESLNDTGLSDRQRLRVIPPLHDAQVKVLGPQYHMFLSLTDWPVCELPISQQPLLSNISLCT